jgi:hypothetical protein
MEMEAVENAGDIRKVKTANSGAALGSVCMRRASGARSI